MTARVVGIGGIFFKARDPDRLRAWYREHLGLAISDWGGVVFEVTIGSRARSSVGSVGVVDPEGNRVELWEPPRVPRS
jgi:hypothetical protein